MIYVQEVESNIKGNVKQTLGPKTLIVGPNGSGKSAIVNSIELALFGFATDLVGRQRVLKEGELMNMTSDKDGLWSKITLSDGVTCSFSSKRNIKGGSSRAERVSPVEANFPVLTVRENLTGSADTAKEFLIKLFDFSDDDIIRRLPTAKFKERYKALRKVTKSKRAIDAVREMIDLVASEVRTNQTDLKAKKAVLNALGIADVEPLSSDIDGAETAYKQAVTAINEARAYAFAQTELVRIMEKKASIATTIAELEAKLVKIDNIPDNAKAVASLATNLISIVDWQGDTCLICSGKVDNRKLLEKQKIWQKHVANAQDLSNRNNVANDLSVANTLLEAWENSITQLSKVKPAGTVAEAEAVLEVAEGKLQRLRSLLQAYEKTTKLREEIIEIDENIAEATPFKDELTRTSDLLLKTVIKQYIDRVQSYLPDQDRFDLTLEPGCKFGLVRNGMMHTTLSGAEWSRLMLAMALATVDPTKIGTTLNVLVPEDRAFDPETLANVLDAVVDAPAQVILTSPIMPSRVNEHWTVIRL